MAEQLTLTLEEKIAEGKRLLAEAKAEKKTAYSMRIGIGEYKGHKVLGIALDNGKVFTFGQSKARAILKHLEMIKQFASIEKTEAPGVKSA